MEMLEVKRKLNIMVIFEFYLKKYCVNCNA